MRKCPRTPLPSRVLLAAMLSISLSPVGVTLPAQAAPTATLLHTPQGTWAGQLKVGPQTLNLEFTFTQAEDGSWNGTLFVKEQTPTPMPFSRVSVEGDRLVAEASAIRATFEATLSPDGQMLSGRWKQGMAKLDLPMSRQAAPLAAPAPQRRPQDPVPPYPYAEEEVRYLNPEGNVTLAGTLTLPRSKGPHPAVLLITGSGPQNRDSELMGHRPFKVIADHLTRRGFAVLRVDDRGVGGSTGSVTDSTSADFAGDVKAGLAFLKTRKEIDPKRLGLIGHSEGALVAAIAAAENPDVAFLVMLAGQGMSGEQVVLSQTDLINQKMGRSEAERAALLRLQKEALAIAASDMPREEAATKLRALFETAVAQNPPETREAAKQQLVMQIDGILSPWYRYFLKADSTPYLRKVTCPVLALNGENDIQVPYRENLDGIAKALSEAGNRDVTIKSLPKLNHLFQTSQTGMVDEYAQIDETFAPVALETLGDWLVKKAFR